MKQDLRREVVFGFRDVVHESNTPRRMAWTEREPRGHCLLLLQKDSAVHPANKRSRDVHAGHLEFR